MKVNETYDQIAELLNQLSKHGETLILIPHRPNQGAEVSGFNGGVKWNFESKRWESYENG